MTLTTSAAAARLSRELADLENTFDNTILASAKLMQTMILARQNPDVTVHEGQKAIIRLARAQQAAIDGASDVFRVHDELASIARERCIMDEPGLTEPSGLAKADDLRAA
ncbi:MAG: hypothetical protein R3D89_07905 [Sphingomonadaceae bacterium]